MRKSSRQAAILARQGAKLPIRPKGMKISIAVIAEA
jgi:hypothetical protein